MRGKLGILGPNFWFLLFALLYLTICGPALADKRVALVVGNSSYLNVPRLDNPKNDARLIADTLRALGFAVVGNGPRLDLDKASFDTVVQDFGNQAQGADVALFYYAGHGVQVRGSNYLIPVDANPTRESDVDFQMLDTNLVLRQMADAGAKLNLVILDACRNNPFGGRGLRAVESGLAQMRAPEGTVISFATQPGSVAKDGADGNSPYTKALVQVMRKPGLGIFEAINEVGLAVKRATGGVQEPWFSSSPIDGSFYFAGPPVTPPQAVVPPSEAERAWAVTKDTTSQAVLEDFILQFGSTVYGSTARARLEELKKSQAAVVAPPFQSPQVPSPCPPSTARVSSSSRFTKPLSLAEECALKPKDTFKECDVCPEMVVVPAGSFTMGSPNTQWGDRERQQHSVTIALPFAVGRFAITFNEWDACTADGGCNGYKPTDQGWGRGQRPVIKVSWDDSTAYVAWLSRKTGKAYRLLSEAEFEYAARGGSITAYPWGNNIGKGSANCKECGSHWTASRLHRSDRSSLMRSAFTTWPAMSGNGCRTAII
jgi:formylglycine-generating enzyme required for sulfatase activity